jgi:hypothetical protein
MAAERNDLDLTRLVRFGVTPVPLEGELALPLGPRGVVIIPHARGTPRPGQDPFVAGKLREAGLGTLLLDLLTLEEQDVDARTAAFRFNIDMLSARLAEATAWLAGQPPLVGLPTGYYASGNAAAAALAAVAARPSLVGAVVCHNGLPDLVERALVRVTVPTLFLVGDEALIGLNQSHLKRLGTAARQFTLVAEAPSLSESDGDEIAGLAAGWFRTHLPSPTPARREAAPTA